MQAGTLSIVSAGCFCCAIADANAVSAAGAVVRSVS
jgi:hypothetical protein